MKASLIDSLDWLYTDSEITAAPITTYECDVPLGGIADVNILITETGNAPFSITTDANEGHLYRYHDVPVEKNTGIKGFTEKEGEINEFVTRRAPFRVFEALEPVPFGVFKPREGANAFRFSIKIPEGRTTPLKKISITVKQGEETVNLTFNVVIHNVKLRPTGKGCRKYTNWIRYDLIASRHNVKPWSEEHFAMIGEYAEMMAHGRQNTFLIPLGIIFSVEDGKPKLNLERLERLVKIFTDAGLYYIEGGHFGGTTTGKWDSPTYSTQIIRELATSPEGCNVIAQICRQLMDAIHKNGWEDRWIQHIADEPTSANASDYRIFSGIVHRYMPGIPQLDATQNTCLVGSVDNWCPLVHEYEQEKAAYDTAKNVRGDGVWFYVCCFPCGKFMNRCLDNELLRPLLLPWGGALYRLDGFLHWALNAYRDWQDPFQMSVIDNYKGGSNSLPAGDTHIIYPGDKGPWSGARFEAMRQGFEDWELLEDLFAVNKEKAEEIIRKIVRGFSDYTTDITLYRKTRKELLEVMSK